MLFLIENVIYSFFITIIFFFFSLIIIKILVLELVERREGILDYFVNLKELCKELFLKVTQFIHPLFFILIFGFLNFITI
jgi:hypothetical protein